MWLKYSDAPILVGEQWDREQSSYLGSYTKPIGFWITDETEDCWRSWCVSERFGLDRLVYKHAVDLDESNILFLRSGIDLDDFTKEFAVAKWWGPDENTRISRDMCIDWRAVAARYSGLIITPYQWSRRLSDNYSWYYTWDCASGCIWTASAIKDVRLIEIDREVAASQAEAA